MAGQQQLAAGLRGGLSGSLEPRRRQALVLDGDLPRDSLSVRTARGDMSLERFGLPRVLEDIDPVLLEDRPMNTAVAYAISAFIVGFGLWILVAGLSSSAPGLWACVALIPILIGLISAFGPK